MTMIVESRRPEGRPKRSPVWNHFKYDQESNESVCTIRNEEKECGARVKGKNPTNLKQHLKCHKDEYRMVMDEEKAKRVETSETSIAKSKSRQAAITSMLHVQPLSKDSIRYKDITRKLALFIGTANVPYSLVENLEFRDLLLELQPCYLPPGRGPIKEKIASLIDIMKRNIQEKLALAPKIHFCCDIWTKKGMTESFLGIVAHFCAKDRNHKATLAVRTVVGPHTGGNIISIFKAVLEEWKIDKESVGKVLTDNGSNMLKAFRILAADYTDPEADSDNEFVENIDDDCITEIREEDILDGLEDDVAEDNSQDDVPAEVMDCENSETDFDVAFNAGSFERLSCFPHTLQLVVSKFDEVQACKDAVSRSKKIVARVNKSSKATEMLKKLAKVKLIGDCPTRWSSTFLLLQQLLRVKSHLELVLSQLGRDGLQATQWKTIENVVELLKPFSDYTNLAGGENYTTISTIVPTIMELGLHLDKVSINLYCYYVTKFIL